MTYLVACLTTGKGSWNSVLNVIDAESWERIFLVTNSFGKEKFSCSKSVEFILVNIDDSTISIRDSIVRQLSGKINFSEVAVNFTSGSGREHMALISALLMLGAGIRLVEFDGSLILLT